MLPSVQFARDAIEYGLNIIPVSEDKIPLFKRWTERFCKVEEVEQYQIFSQVTGQQSNGEFWIGPEFDHKPADGVDATANFNLFRSRLSDDLYAKLWVTRSTSGTGYHIRAITPRAVPGSIVRDDKGHKIGDFRSTGGHLLLQDESKWISGAPWTMRHLTETELDQLLAALNYRQPVTTDNLDFSLPWSEVDYWLTNIEALLKDGVPDRFSPTCQGTHFLKNTIPARRSSDIRYAVIEELIAAEYDDGQAAALALHLTDFGVSKRKGRSWLEVDVTRIIGKIRAGGVRARHRQQRVHQQTLDVGNCGGRPRKQKLEEFLIYLKRNATGDRVLLTQKQIASELSLSVRTVQRLEKEATAAGLLERRVYGHRQDSYIVLLERDDKTCDTQEVNTPDRDSAPRAQGGVGGTGMSVRQNGMPELPPGVMRNDEGKPITRHLIEAGIQLAENVRSREKRLAIVIAFVLAYDSTVNPDWIKAEWQKLDVWNKQRRADERLVERLRAMTDRQLRAARKGAERQSADAHARGSPGEAWIHGRRAWFIGREFDRREPLRRVLRDKSQQVSLL